MNTEYFRPLYRRLADEDSSELVFSDEAVKFMREDVDVIFSIAKDLRLLEMMTRRPTTSEGGQCANENEDTAAVVVVVSDAHATLAMLLYDEKIGAGDDDIIISKGYRMSTFPPQDQLALLIAYLDDMTNTLSDRRRCRRR